MIYAQPCFMKHKAIKEPFAIAGLVPDQAIPNDSVGSQLKDPTMMLAFGPTKPRK